MSNQIATLDCSIFLYQMNGYIREYPTLIQIVPSKMRLLRYQLNIDEIRNFLHVILNYGVKPENTSSSIIAIHPG